MSISTNELKPNKENLINCLKNDSIDRNEALRRFILLCDSIDFGCSIAIDGKWGDGKTFFVKQAKLIFDASNPYVDEELLTTEKEEILSTIDPNGALGIKDFMPQVCVYYDAWVNDNDNDPLLSIVCEIASTASIEYSKIDNNGLAKKVAAIASAITKRDLNSIVACFEKENLLEELHKQRVIDNVVNEFLDSLLVERGKRLIVIIDELDRCRPTFAVQLLERIKHYFDNERITFVFSINSLELQHSIKKHYGEAFDASRYLDRFFDFRISLPEANMEKYYSSIGVTDYRNVFDYICKRVAKQYGFSMRESERFFRISYNAAFNMSCRDNAWGFPDSNGYSMGFMVIVPLLIGLKMINIQSYYNFVEGKEPGPLVDLFNNDDKAYLVCRYLLKQDETFDPNKTGQTLVSLEDKLIEVYNAIFNNVRNETIYVGKCGFERNFNKMIIDTASLLSEYASFDTIR